MRHFRMPCQNINGLITLQKHVGSILNEIGKFEGNDKRKALSYVKNLLKLNKGKGNSEIAYKTTRSRKKNGLVTVKPRRSSIKDRKAQNEYFSCLSCDIVNENRVKHLKHLEAHGGVPRSCLKCKRTFAGQVSFDWHLQYYCLSRKPLKPKNKCNQCFRIFCSQRDLKRHLDGHRRNNCKFCDKVFTHNRDLIYHLLKKHSLRYEKPLHKCPDCDKRYVKQRSLFYHFKQHASDKIVCLECGHASNNIEESDEHRNKHEEEKKFMCSFCNEKFIRRQQYLCHVKKHDLYKCITCKESYGSRQKVLFHKRQNHIVEGSQPRFICPHCPELYYKKNTLITHLGTHEEIKTDIECKYCKKSFLSLDNYFQHCISVSHEKFHLVKELHNCQDCEKQFSKKSLLDEHEVVIHSKIRKSLKCAYCSYITSYKNNFERHIKLHFDDNNDFICEQCAKVFTSLAGLKDHMSYSHIQNKVLPCSECGKTFKRTSELNRHRLTHSDNRPHVCVTCGATYKRVTHLRRHEKSAHNIQHNGRKTQKVLILPDGSTVLADKDKKEASNKKLKKSQSEDKVEVPANTIFVLQPLIVENDILEIVNLTDISNDVFRG